MRAKPIAACLALIACAAAGASAQQTGTGPVETRAALNEPAAIVDAEGRVVLAARLLTTQLVGTPDAPALNSRFAVENRGALFYTYVSGWATFYDAGGLRCGEGLWTLPALAPGETAEVDTPGLRLTCTPASWRVVATTLLTRAAETASTPERAPVASAPLTTGSPDVPTARPTTMVPPLEININGKTIPIQLGNPVEITIGRERVRIIVSPAP